MEQRKKPLDELNQLQERYRQALEGLVPLARAAVNLLKDLNHPSSARDIEAQLFTIEGIQAETRRFVQENPLALLEALRESFQK